MMHPLPKHQIGMVSPVSVSDEMTYQFYRIFSPDCILVAYPIGLQSFTPEGVDAALENFWEAFDFLVARGVERIVQGGIPVSALAGRPRILKFIEEASRRSKIPTSADFEEVIEAFQSLGVRRVAVACKWDERLMNGIKVYLADAGIEVVGQATEVHTTQQVLALGHKDGVEMALRLGRRALQSSPQAEGLLLAGGAWLSSYAVPDLEAEFGKPVVTNPNATFWAALRQVGIPSMTKGWGRLIDNVNQG